MGTNIFLLTFVAACSLIQLVTFELSGSEPVDADITYSLGLLGNIKYFISFLYLHPHLRQIAWNVTLYLLCVLLNVVIPVMITVILFRGQFKRSPWKMIALSISTFLLYQFFLWSIGEILPVNNTKVGFYDLNRDKSFIYFIFHRSLQQSVAHLAAIGTAFSALINGFASVNFPLEQLMIMKGVDKSVVNERDIQLKNILQGIINRKKKIALEAFSIAQYKNVNQSPSSSSHDRNFDNLDDESRCNVGFGIADDYVMSNNSFHNQPASSTTGTCTGVGIASQRTTERIRRNNIDNNEKMGTIEMSHTKDVEDFSKAKNNFLYFKSFVLNSLRNLWTVLGFDDLPTKKPDIKKMLRHQNSSAVRLSNLSASSRALQREILFMEKMSRDCFVENTYFRDLYEQSEYKKTGLGRFLYSLGHMLSAFALLRFLGGLRAVIGYVIRFWSSYSISIVDESTYDGIVSTVLSYLQEHVGLHVDVSFWSPLLSFVLITSLALMQIRGFLDTTKQISLSQMDQKGFSVLKGEIYSLLLAYAAGSYFLACVVLLRVHLPRRFRIGVTVVLGEDRDFGFYMWWYEIVFVIGTIVAAVYLWSKKKRRRIELEPILTKAKFEQKQRIIMMNRNSMNDSNHSNDNHSDVIDQTSTETSVSNATIAIDVGDDRTAVNEIINVENIASNLTAWTSSIGRYFSRTKINTS